MATTWTVGGQTFQLGSMWGGNYPAPGHDPETGNNYYWPGSYPKYVYEMGTPFNVLQWLLDFKLNGDLSNLNNNTTEYWFTYQGVETQNIEEAYMTIGYKVSNGRYFFGIALESNSINHLCNGFINTGYEGMDKNNPTELDRAFADAYFFKPCAFDGVKDLTYPPLCGAGGVASIVHGDPYNPYQVCIYMNGGTCNQEHTPNAFNPMTSGRLQILPVDGMFLQDTSIGTEGDCPSPLVMNSQAVQVDVFHDGSFGYYHTSCPFPEDLITVVPDEAESEEGQGSSHGGGGGGGNHYVTESLDDLFEDLPSTGFTDSGMGLLYQPTKLELHQLSVFLWSDDFITNIKQLTSSPIDGIISLMHLPINLATAKLGREKVRNRTKVPIVIGDVVCKDPNEASITSYLIQKSYASIDLGTIHIDEQFGNAYDYDPYTSMQLYLPYVGFVQLDASEVFSPKTWTENGTDLQIMYIVNLLTGEAVARVGITKPEPNLTMTNSNGYFITMLGQFSCTLGFSMPITGANYVNFYKNQMNSQLGMVGGVASIIGGLSSSNPALVSGGLGQMIQSGSNQMFNGPSMMKSGSISGSSSPMSYTTPFLEIMNPCSVMDDKEHRQLNGLPASRYEVLNNLLKSNVDDSYAEFESVRTTDFSGTAEEEKELINILKTGVYINS